MAISFCCGFECRAGATYALASQGHWYSCLFNGQTIQQTYARNGGWALHFNASSVAQFLKHDLGGDNNACTRFYLYFPTLPSTDYMIVGGEFVAGYTGLFYNSTTDKLCVGTAAGSKTDLSVTMEADRWYCIDLRIVSSANPHTVDVQIDGVAQTQWTNAVASALYYAWMWGNSTAWTGEFVMDDVAVGSTTIDYPIGAGKIVGYRVTSTSGTHNQTAGDLQNDASSNVTNGDSSGAKVNETSAPDMSSYVKQVVARNTTYWEGIYDTSGVTIAPRWVNQLVAVRPVTAGANDQKAQLYDGTSAADSYALVATGTDTTYPTYFFKHWLEAPSTGAWTLGKFQAARIRWGFSSTGTASYPPAITATILEAEFEESSAPEATAATSTGAAYTAAFATASGDYAGTIVAQGAIAYWRLGEPSGSTASDEIASADGTYFNSPTLGVTGLLAGDADKAVTFTRTSLHHVSVATGIPVGSSTGATISARVKLASTAEGNIYTVLRWGAESATVGFHWLYYRQYSATEYLVYWEYADGAAYRKTWTAWQPTLGQAYSLAAVHDYAAETVKFYVDGVLLATKDVSAYGTPVSVAANAPTFIGAYSATQHPWDGTLDEPAIFDAALSATDIADQHTAATTGSPPSTATAQAASATGSAVDASAEGTLPPGLTLQQYINGTPTGGTLNVTGMTFSAGATISRAITITGGTINVPSSSKGLIITASNVTIDGMTITGRQATTFNGTEYGIHAYGTHAAHLTGLTITDCTISNFGYACVWYTHTTGATISRNTLSDAVYVGVMAYCAWNSTISWNRITDIGETANVPVSGRDLYNAYGIAVTGYTGINSQDVEVTDNLVVNVPWWHGVDTHSGIRVGFRRNVMWRCSRGVFITSGYGSPTDIEIEGNFVLDPSPVTFNLRPITFAGATNVTVWDNRIIGWGAESPTEAVPWYDYASSSTGLLNAGGNRVVSGKGVAAAIHPYVDSSSELAGPITATGTARAATFASGVTVPDRDADAECATATGAAFGAGVLREARTATATGTANGPAASVKATSVLATATGMARGSSLALECATGSGSASAVKPSLGATGVLGTATGAAANASTSTSSLSSLEAAAATGEAYGTDASIRATNAAATGTGAAANASATIVTGARADAECATGTGAAAAATVTVGVAAGTSAGTGEANSLDSSTTFTAGAAAATGASYGTATKFSVPVGAASGVGTAVPLSFALRPQGGIATSTGAALAGSSALGAPAGAASASGTAHGLTWSGTSRVSVTAGVATGIGLARKTKRGHRGGVPPRGHGHHWTPRAEAATVS